MRGALTGLARWPVKSMAGEALEEATVDELGLAGDRAHSLVDLRPQRHGKLLYASRAPRLLAWSASYPGGDGIDPADPPPPVVRGPAGGSWRWDEPGLAEALAADLGMPVELRRAVGQQDRGPTLLVTVEGTRQAVERTLGRPLDRRRFRPNLHVELDAPPYAEERWAGRGLRVGEATLELTEPCKRCVVPTWDPDHPERWPELLTWLFAEHEGNFGIIAEVRTPGRIRLGDPVTLV